MGVAGAGKLVIFESLSIVTHPNMTTTVFKLRLSLLGKQLEPQLPGPKMTRRQKTPFFVFDLVLRRSEPYNTTKPFINALRSFCFVLHSPSGFTQQEESLCSDLLLPQLSVWLFNRKQDNQKFTCECLLSLTCSRSQLTCTFFISHRYP